MLLRKNIAFDVQSRQKPITARIIRSFLQSPARVSILLFACLIGVGTLLLTLPSASENDRLSLVNALFTS